MRNLFWFQRLTIVLISFSICACAHTSKDKPLSPKAAAKLSVKLGHGLEGPFENQLIIKNDPVLLEYITHIAKHMAHSVSGLRGHLGPHGTVSIKVVRSLEAPRKNFSLPGGKVYLSVERLHPLEFENELAAEIAIQLAHIQNKIVLKRFKEDLDFLNEEHVALSEVDPEDVQLWISNVDFFGEEGLFTLNEAEELLALDGAVDIMYHGGYDVRGLLTVLNRMSEHPDCLPSELRKINRFKEYVRGKMTLYAPLLNPIVRTQEFVAMKKRIERL